MNKVLCIACAISACFYTCKKAPIVQTDPIFFTFTHADSAVMQRLQQVNKLVFIVSDSLYTFSEPIEVIKVSTEMGNSEGYTSDPTITGIRPANTPWMKMYFYDSIHRVTFWLSQQLRISPGGTQRLWGEVNYCVYFGHWKDKDLINNSRMTCRFRYTNDSWDHSLIFHPNQQFSAAWLGTKSIPNCYARDYTKMSSDFLEDEKYYAAAFNNLGLPVFYAWKGTPSTYGIYGPFGKNFVFQMQ